MAFFRQQFSAPVKEGEELDVKIEAVGEKGDGIAKINGFVLFVPGTKMGDEVKIKVTKVLRKVGFAEVVGKASAPVKAAEEGEEKTEKKPAKAKKESKAKSKKSKVEEIKEEPVKEFEEEEEDTEEF